MTANKDHLIILVVSIGLLLNIALSIRGEDGISDPLVSPTNQITKLWRDSAPILALAVGDFDVSHAGDELVCGGESGIVTMLAGNRTQWTATPLYQTAGEVRFLDIGDLDPAHEGNELVVATHNSHLVLDGGNDPPEYWGIRMLSGNGTTWASSLVFSTQSGFGALWGLAVGDYNSSHPGDEIVACWEFWYDIANVFMYTNDNGIWTSTLLYVGNAVIMDAEIGEVNASHPGTEIILLDEDGDYIQLIQNEGTWEPTCIWAAPLDFAGRELEIGDVDLSHPGNEVVVRTRYLSGLILLSETNGHWTPTWIYRATVPFSDVVISDISPSHQGNEIVIAHENNVTLLWGRGTLWSHRTLWRDTATVTCIASGDFDSFYPGEELAAAGFSQYVSRITSRPLPFPSITDPLMK